tara:strand:+ start:32922 stop:33668 length:747 start_codon:yes stop_codon:yes gene_type:complete
MATFESLEDSFLKKSSEQITTDFQASEKHRQEALANQTRDEDKYENIIKKKNVKMGLAAMLEQKIKSSREVASNTDQDAGEEDTTVFFSTESVRYEDVVAIPQTEVSEEDIQRFYPHEKYTDVYSAPETAIKDDVRFEDGNKYGDMLQNFEPNTATADDIPDGRSVSSISAPGEPSMNPDKDEVLHHIHQHNLKKSGDGLGPTEKPTFEETILDEETYLGSAGRRPEETTPQADIPQQTEGTAEDQTS